METTLTNGWTILTTEEDGALLDYIKNHPIEEPAHWHDHLGEMCINEYLQPYGRVRNAVDVGANIGFFSREFSTFFNHVHSFELDADVRECLKSNTSDLSNVSVYEFGLGAEQKEVEYKFDNRSGYTRIINYQTNKTGSIDTLDSLGLTDIDLIKIDVEGYELNVLEGAKNTISQYKPLLIIEINNSRGQGTFDYRKKIYSLLDSYGYVIKDAVHHDYVFYSTS